MSLLSWARRTLSLKDPKSWTALVGQDSWSGKSVTLDTAMQVSAFWACVRLIAQTIGTLPIGVYERRPDGGRTARGDHPLYALLHDQPNADQTAVEFWEGMAAWLCLWGNAYAEKLVTAGQVRGLTLLRSDLMSVRRKPDGSIGYRYSGPDGAREYSEADLLHIKGFGLGCEVGLSPLAFARQSLGAAMATDEAAARSFSNGMRPSGFFLYDKTLTKEQREQAHKVLVDPMVGAGNTAKIGILEAGFTWQQVTIPPEDMQMLQTRGFQVEEVCRWYGVPPILVGHSAAGQTMWGTGVEQIMIGWLTLGLRPYLTRIEQSIKRSIIAPAERGRIYAEINVEGLLRADSAGRAEFYSKMVQNAGITPNEMRAKENLPAMPGGDELLINSTLIPLSQAGKPRAGASTGGASPAASGAAAGRPNLEVVR